MIADASGVPIVAVRAEHHPFDGAEPHRRVLHEYREQQTKSESNCDHADIISAAQSQSNGRSFCGSPRRAHHRLQKTETPAKSRGFRAMSSVASGMLRRKTRGTRGMRVSFFP